MDKYIFNESNGLWYELRGDYYFLCLTTPAEEQSVGIWGQRHRQHLKNYHPSLYDALLLSGSLNRYLADIDQQAEVMISKLVQQLAQCQGVTEQLKANDQVAWVGKMNNILASAMEIIGKEIIYT